jgi:hypothetical protein
MKSSPTTPAAAGLPVQRFWFAFAVLFVVLGLLFIKSLSPNYVHFSNDGPLGAAMAEQFRVPAAFTGVWTPLNWVGGNAGSSAPNLTNFFLWATGPVWFAKFYAPFSILVLGLCAWLAFRQLKFSPATCLAGSLAAALNGGFFSYACWGLGTLTLTIAAFFLAIAAWGSDPATRTWMRVVLSGFAIGLGIMEGFDNGAILSVFFAGYVLVRTWAEHPGQPGKLAGGVGRLAVIALMAGVFATHALYALISTQVQGVAGMAQDEETRQKRWTEATMWSLPKAETLRLFVAGLYGYRLDTPKGGNYWGAVGQHPAWDAYYAQENPNPAEAPQGALRRHSGSGFYTGVFVCLLALWAVFRSCGGPGTVYRPGERRLIWFWAAMALSSLLLSWGRHAPFYALAYELPYFSTIRNPIKFLHPLNIALVVLFAYGVEGLWRSWVGGQPDGATVKERLARWWRGTQGFERHWIIGSGIFVAGSLFATLLYGSMKEEMIHFFVAVVPTDPTTAAAMFRHSVTEILWSILFLVAGVVLVALMMSGALRRQGAGTAGIVAILLVTGLDLVRSNLPWIQHFDYKARYARAPLFDFLANQPWEHRAQMLPGALLSHQFGSLQGRVNGEQLQQLFQLFMNLSSAYGGEWHQHQFQFFNIQSLDRVQEPRPTVENELYRQQFPQPDPAAQLRLMRLTNARYFLGLGQPVLEPLNQLAAAEGGEFREVMSVWMAQNGDHIIPAPNTNLPFALLEFTGALPRARLYANWQIEPATNSLAKLTSREFDPGRLVFVEGDCPAPAKPEATDAGTVTITDYHPKRVQMKANVQVPAVLLFNDKHDPNWKVWVDGQPAPLLKANYLMRGLHLPPGEHEIVWRFQPPTEGLYVSVAAIFAGIILTGLTVVQSRRSPSAKNALTKAV